MLFKIRSVSGLIGEYDDVLQGKFNYQRNEDTSPYFSRGTVELNSVEDFMELIKIVKHDLIIREPNLITIYDDYIE